MTIDHVEVRPTNAAVTGEPQLFCALTGKPVRAEEAYWAPPLVTARELVSVVARSALTSPGTLSHILFDAQPDVPYAPDAREQLAGHRAAEQLKLLVGLLVAVALIVVPIVLLAMR